MNSNTLPAVASSLIDGGYACREYALSLAEFGDVEPLPQSGGSLLVRPTPDGSALDGMGPYPLFACRDWSRVGDDLAALADRLVSIAVVTDPFAEASLVDMQEAFPDVCYAYKRHYVSDLSRPLEEITPSHHRRNVRKALRSVEVRPAEPNGELLTQWLELYGNLIERHAITGIARFSPTSFERQMHVPGFVAYEALEGGRVCGMTMWYVRQGVAYYHLAAYSDRGYELGASFALFATALASFAEQGVGWAALGAGAGTAAGDSGLTRFKQGWSTETRPVHFCGRILQPELYRRLAGDAGATAGFFPAYRRIPA